MYMYLRNEKEIIELRTWDSLLLIKLSKGIGIILYENKLNSKWHFVFKLIKSNV